MGHHFVGYQISWGFFMGIFDGRDPVANSPPVGVPAMLKASLGDHSPDTLWLLGSKPI